MDINKILEGSLDDIADNIFNETKNTADKAKAIQKQRIGENVQYVIAALKKIETDMRGEYSEVANKLYERIVSIKNGQDGRNGADGRAGKDGRAGRDGLAGSKGADGLPGRDGLDGVDGVSVMDANIDFDGSLIITLSNGRVINVGEVVSQDLADKIQVISTMSTNTAIAAITGGTIDGAVIGGTTPAAGTFTTLSASSGINSTSIGSTTPAAGAFTTVTATGKTGIALTNNSVGITEVQIGNTVGSADTDGSGVGFYFSGIRLGGIRLVSSGVAPKTIITAWSGAAEVTVASITSTGLAVTGTLSATGVATFAAGTFALPSITTSGDPNTGVYFPAADTVGITAGGTQRGEFSSAGLAVTGALSATTNIGVGTTAPSIPGPYNSVVDIRGTAADQNWGGALRLASNNGTTTNSYFLATTSGLFIYNTIAHPITFGTSNTERMRIDSSGNVGIGTASPNASAILDAQSTTKGVRMPNMTTTQKNAIASPAAGLMVYDTTLAKLCVYTTAWETITSI